MVGTLLFSLDAVRRPRDTPIWKISSGAEVPIMQGGRYGQLREIAILQFKGRMNRVTPGGFFFSFFSFSIWPI